MNAYFNFNRWLLFVGKHWNENKRRYLMALAAIGALLIMWFSFLMIINKVHPLQEGNQVSAYYVGLFLTGCLYASLIFNDLSDNSKGISYLLLPASLLEKLLTAILFAIVLYFLCYTAVFYIVDFIMVKLTNSVVAARALQEHVKGNHIQDISNVFVTPKVNGDNFYIYVLMIFFCVQSIFFAGSVYFQKHNYIKTLIAGLIVFLLLMLFQHKLLGSFMPDGGFYKPFTVYRVYDAEKGELSIQLPVWISEILLFLIKYSLPPLLWIVTYFRLKEKEV